MLVGSIIEPRSMAMQDQANAPQRVPWNKGKLTGAKPPLRPKHVWSIRTKLQIKGRTRDLAMFNLAIDSKLRGCDVVAMRVEDVPGQSGHALPVSNRRFVPTTDSCTAAENPCSIYLIGTAKRREWHWDSR